MVRWLYLILFLFTCAVARADEAPVVVTLDFKPGAVLEVSTETPTRIPLQNVAEIRVDTVPTRDIRLLRRDGLWFDIEAWIPAGWNGVDTIYMIVRHTIKEPTAQRIAFFYVTRMQIEPEYRETVTTTGRGLLIHRRLDAGAYGLLRDKYCRVTHNDGGVPRYAFTDSFFTPCLDSIMRKPQSWGEIKSAFVFQFCHWPWNAYPTFGSNHSGSLKYYRFNALPRIYKTTTSWPLICIKSEVCITLEKESFDFDLSDKIHLFFEGEIPCDIYFKNRQQTFSLQGRIPKGWQAGDSIPVTLVKHADGYGYQGEVKGVNCYLDSAMTIPFPDHERNLYCIEGSLRVEFPDSRPELYAESVRHRYLYESGVVSDSFFLRLSHPLNEPLEVTCSVFDFMDSDDHFKLLTDRVVIPAGADSVVVHYSINTDPPLTEISRPILNFHIGEEKEKEIRLGGFVEINLVLNDTQLATLRPTVRWGIQPRTPLICPVDTELTIPIDLDMSKMSPINRERYPLAVPPEPKIYLEGWVPEVTIAFIGDAIMGVDYTVSGEMRPLDIISHYGIATLRESTSMTIHPSPTLDSPKTIRLRLVPTRGCAHLIGGEKEIMIRLEP